MTSVGVELVEALREGGRPRLVEAIRKLRELLANVNLGRVAELLKGLMELLDQVGILPSPVATADDAELEAACLAACGHGATHEHSAQAIDLASLMALIKLIVDLIRRLSKPQE